MVSHKKEKNGMTIFSWSTGDPAVVLPIKKRRFLSKCPPSPPPSHLPYFATDNLDIQSNDTSLAAEPSISVVSNQMPDMGCTDFRGASLACKVESFIDRENPAPRYRVSPGFNGGVTFSFGDTASTEFGNGGQQTSQNISAFQPILGPISEKNDFRSSLGDGSVGNGPTLSDESAFQKVLEKTELYSPLNSHHGAVLVEQNALSNSVKQENLDSCALELALSKQLCSSQSKQNDGESMLVSGNQYSRRFQWDLNTTMDAWEESVDDAASNHGASGIDDLNLGYLHGKKVEIDPASMIRQEPCEFNLMFGKVEHSNSGSLKLSNALKLPHKQCDTNIDLNLQLNTNFGSMEHTDLCTTHATTMLSSHKMSDPSLSVEAFSLARTLNLSVCGGVKTEPVEEDSREYNKKMEMSNSKTVNHSIVKLAPLDCVEKESPKAKCQNGMRSARENAVKCGQAIASCLKDIGATEDKGHYPEPYANTQGAVDTREMDQDTKGNGVASLDLINWDSAISVNKAFDIMGTPNVVPSKIMDEITKAPAFVSKLPGFGGSKLDFGQNASYSVVASHGVHHSSRNQVSEPATSDMSDSQNALLMPICADVPQNTDKNVIKASGMVFESPILVGNEFNRVKGAREVAESNLDSKEQTIAGDIPQIVEEMPYLECGSQSSQFVSMDVHNLDPSIGNKRAETDTEKKAEKPENELDGSLEAVGISEIVTKLHGGDDCCQDAEVGGPLLHSAVDTCDAKPKKNVDMEAVKFDHPVRVPSDLPVQTASNVAGNDSNFKNPDELKDVCYTIKCKGFLCTKKNDAGLSMAEDAKESFATGVPIVESCKNEVMKNSHKLPRESSEEPSEMKAICMEIVGSSYAAGADNTSGVLGNQARDRVRIPLPADHSGLCKRDVSQAHDATGCVQRSNWSHIRHQRSSSNASLAGRKNSIHRKSSLLSGRERSWDMSCKGGKRHVKSSRYKRCVDQVYKSEKGRVLDQPHRKPRSDSLHMRRDVQQLDTLHGSCDLDHRYASERFNMPTRFQLPRLEDAPEGSLTVGMPGSYKSAGTGRMGRKHIHDDLENLRCPPARRLSSGWRGAPLVDVQMNPGMRSISPGRCIGGIPKLYMVNCEEMLMNDFAADMADAEVFPRTHPTYVRGENCLIRRERSLSPAQKRPHLPQISLASSPRTQAQSCQLWSPSQRSHNNFGHLERSLCGSPPVPRVERVSSPCRHTCFPQDLLGRGHDFPHIPQLHYETGDIGPLKEHNLHKPDLHLQENVRGPDLIDHQLNEHHSGHLQSRHLCELKEYDVCADERRNSDEGHEQVLPFRQCYIVGNNDENDRSFHHHVEDIPPRPIRLCQDIDGGLPERGISRDVCDSNKLGNMHRRPRVVEEREDNYRHHGGQGWSGAGPKRIQQKRR